VSTDITITHNTKENINNYFLSMLKDIASKNSDGDESSHKVIGMTRLQNYSL
jgi:hypothetical protein